MSNSTLGQACAQTQAEVPAPLAHIFANGKALIPFITAGDPNLTITEQLIAHMALAGADLIELGIPFSDSNAADPIIKKAELRALTGGATMDKIFAMLGRLRQYCNVPIALMSYLNPIYAYGPTRFMKNCHAVAICAVIVPDLPFEERADLLPDCRANDVTLISMIAPTSRERVQMIAKQAQGFIYCLTPPAADPSEVRNLINQVKNVRQIPCAVGLNDSGDHLAHGPGADAGDSPGDGVVAKSSIARIIEQYGPDSAPQVAEYVRTMKNRLRSNNLHKNQSTQ